MPKGVASPWPRWFFLVCSAVCWDAGRLLFWGCGSPDTGGLYINLTLEQFGIDRLSPPQRLELIDLIWASLPDDAPFSPPDWHLRELEQRIAAADVEPGGAEPWETVLARLSRKQ